MKEISLTQGKFVQVSDEDRDLAQRAWRFDRYAGRRDYQACPPATVYMHQEIMRRMLGGPIPEGYEVDHIDGNKLNNQRANLRLATRQQNVANRNGRGAATSQYKGVSWDAKNKNWRASIRANYKSENLGRYASEEQAARAYDKAAREHFGEFAWLNFPDE